MRARALASLTRGDLADDLDYIARRFAVLKAEDPLDPDDFLRLEARLIRKLRKAFAASKEPFVEALEGIIGEIEPTTPPEAIEGIVRRLASAIQGIDRAAARDLGPILEGAIADVYRLTKGAVFGRLVDAGRLVGTQETRGAGFGVRDERAIDALMRHQHIYVRQGVRSLIDDFDDRAKDVLVDGLERGLTRKQLAGRLVDTFGDTVGSEDYWNIVGSAWVNRARNWGTLQTFEDVEIERFIIIAVMDERTSTICRMMNGTTFEVKRQLQIMEQIALDDDLDALKKRSPWLRTRLGEDGEEEVGYKRGGQWTAIGSAGRLSSTPSEIQEAGIALPPYHGFCRTTVGAP